MIFFLNKIKKQLFFFFFVEREICQELKILTLKKNIYIYTSIIRNPKELLRILLILCCLL